MPARVLVNCSNLHVGGGVAVASSFLDCLDPDYCRDAFEIHVLVSSSVNANVVSLGVDTNRFASYRVKDIFGIKALMPHMRRCFRGFDLVFTVFGPNYGFSSNVRNLVGFAQPNIIYPRHPLVNMLTTRKRLSRRVKYLVQTWFFSKSSAIVVELDHVKYGLRKKGGFRDTRIYIVKSAVHHVYLDKNKWEDIHVDEGSGDLCLGIISKNYLHKNLSILPKVKEILSDQYGLNVSFFVTFTPEEWSKCEPEFKMSIVNVGGLNLAQCPTFYSKMDGVIFPSVLECFSAVPIEAMKLKKPIFASDLNFIRDVCDTHANYFDPLSPDSVAKSVYEFFSLPEESRQEIINNAFEFMENYPGPDVRARNYLDIIRTELEH